MIRNGNTFSHRVLVRKNQVRHLLSIFRHFYHPAEIKMNKIKLEIIEKLMFIYSEKATKFCEIFTLLLSYVVPVKSKVKISQNFLAFSEYMSFIFKETIIL